MTENGTQLFGHLASRHPWLGIGRVVIEDVVRELRSECRWVRG